MDCVFLRSDLFQALSRWSYLSSSQFFRTRSSLFCTVLVLMMSFLYWANRRSFPLKPLGVMVLIPELIRYSSMAYPLGTKQSKRPLSGAKNTSAHSRKFNPMVLVRERSMILSIGASIQVGWDRYS